MPRFRFQRGGGFALIFGPIIFIAGLSEGNSTAIIIGLLLIIAAIGLLFLNNN
jgi:hypothetical protein